MKNILLLTIVLFGITACNTSSNTQNTLPISIACNNTDDTSNYQVLQSGDIISKPETLHKEVSTAPEVKIFHTEDGVKKVCLQSGTAIILR
jgi:hypothetical protein